MLKLVDSHQNEREKLAKESEDQKKKDLEDAKHMQQRAKECC